jgi:L-2-hydroxyglutarate oxidase
MPEHPYDVIVIGGGIVGLSTAMHLLRAFPRLRVAVLEKEAQIASHQTGHNSGVIHSGIYYKPGSLKAKLCVEGAAAMVRFCREHGVPHEVCGKVIVATREEELPALRELIDRGQVNGLKDLRLLSREELRDIEPHCGGLAAIHVPSTGITDYAMVSREYARQIANSGGKVSISTQVKGFARDNGTLVIETNSGEFHTRYVINCAGLQSDRVARMAGQNPDLMIVPFRGEYYDLVPAKYSLVRNLIYPVPDPRFPFLGVHFTRRIHGSVDAGPNAVLALRREGYRRTDFDMADAMETITFPGFRTMAAKYWRHGAGEFYRSFHKAAFVKALQRLIPEIHSDDLIEGGSGVRAQALRRDGTLVDDFQFVFAENMLHVYNVPSPAATASLVIGREIGKMAGEGFGL